MKNKKIAITGGIGSGKSQVLKILNSINRKVVSCDEVTKKLYKTNKVKREIKKIFPLAVSGRLRLRIDKGIIATEAFTNPIKLKYLNDVMHPLIMKNVMKTAERVRGKVYVEVPLLFECGLENEFDDVIVVMREKQARIESVKARSNISEEEILRRMKNQVDYDTLDLSKYKIIVNDGNIKELTDKITELDKIL